MKNDLISLDIKVYLRISNLSHAVPRIRYNSFSMGAFTTYC